ncbi:WYL domain-containing protein [Corynebacterium sp.]|uniref:helix-turn-helix transcriptional regulator n=1 Tax=Corynebacterium sp. TaxID=1720 RepID=UPI0028A80725|nr:WYL domain-containing protein [Corynebacterium sp.]
MRADRLVSLVLLLRQRGQLSADTLARELEVSTRTVLRDIEALSNAGVPVYAERGRHGGFALLPGFRTELTGLTHEEALALLAASVGHGRQEFGLGTALASAIRKVIDALPDTHAGRADDVPRRFLVEPDIDLLARRRERDDVPVDVMAAVRSAVLAGHKLRMFYATVGKEPRWRTVDPIGLVTVRDKGYLLAQANGEDRTYRLSRIRDAEELDVIAQRPEVVDLDELWRQRSARFRNSGETLTARLRTVPERREEIAATALAVHAEETDPEGRLIIDASFQDLRHAVWALWQLDTGAEALSPDVLRSALCERASEMAERYSESG